VSLLSKVLNFVFPEFCKLCNKPLADKRSIVCRECLEKLPIIKLHCEKCGTPLDEKIMEVLPHQRVSYCSYCMEHNFYFDMVIPAFFYKEPVSQWITEVKFGCNYTLSYRLGKLLKIVLKNIIPEVDVVIPLPLSSKRLQKRGFNQSLMLAWGFTGKKPSQRFLKRIKDTRAQTELSQKERWENVKNAFLASAEVKNKVVLLVDDVMTTGATVNEAAKALKQAGARKVYVMVLARSVLN